jgi:membrane carboxypeptidase/penicillin-binding protein
MKRALQYYPDVKPFPQPAGIVTADICRESGLLAGAFCQSHMAAAFAAGTQPQSYCLMHMGAGEPAQVISNTLPANDRVAPPF